MMRLAKSMPRQQRDGILQQIRLEFRKSADIDDTESVSALLDKAASSLSYMKIVAPRKAPSKNQQGYTRITFGGPKNAKRPDKAVSNWTGNNLDPDSVARHYHGLKRAGFRNNSDMKGIF